MFQFRVVGTGPRGMTQTDFEASDTSQEDFEAAMQKSGYVLTGRESRRQLRADLQGRPKFAELCGPMYDGTNDKGHPVIRYESVAAYAQLSA